MRRYISKLPLLFLLLIPLAFAEELQSDAISNGLNSFTPFGYFSNGEAINLSNGNLLLQWKDAIVPGRSGASLYFSRSYASDSKITIEAFNGLFEGAENHYYLSDVEGACTSGGCFYNKANGDIDRIEYYDKELNIPSLGSVKSVSENKGSNLVSNEISYDPQVNGWDVSWAPLRGVVVLTDVSPNRTKHDRDVILVKSGGELELFNGATGQSFTRGSGNVLLDNVIPKEGSPEEAKDPLEGLSELNVQDDNGYLYTFVPHYKDSLFYNAVYSYGCWKGFHHETCHDTYDLTGWKVDAFILKEYKDAYGNIVRSDNPAPVVGESQKAQMFFQGANGQSEILWRTIERNIFSDHEEWVAPGIDGNRVWNLSVDEKRRFTNVTDPAGNITTLEYDPKEGLKVFPFVRRFGFDEFADPIKFIQVGYPTGGYMRYEFFDDSELKYETATKNVVVTEIPDANNIKDYFQKYYRVQDKKDAVNTEVYREDGAKVGLTFEKKFGQLLLKTKTAVANGREVIDTYNWAVDEHKKTVSGLKKVDIARDGASYTSYSAEYDDAGRTLTITDANSNKRIYSYKLPSGIINDSLNLDTSLTPKDISENLRQKNLVTSIEQDVSGITHREYFQYDGSDKCGGSVPIGMAKKRYQQIGGGEEREQVEDCYDAYANVIKTYEGGFSNPNATISYDENHIFPTSKITSSGEVLKYSYDSNTGLLLTAEYGGGSKTNYLYNSLGQLTKLETFNQGLLYQIDHEYIFKNDGGSPNQINTVIHDGLAGGDFSVKRKYNGTGQLVQVDKNGSAKTYGYDSLERLGSVTYPDGRQLSIVYDGFDRVLDKYLTGVTPLHYVYTVNAADSDKGKLLLNDVTNVYLDGSLVYKGNKNLLGRLISESKYLNDAELVTTYQRDALGNVTKIASPSGISIDNNINYVDGTIARTYPGGDVVKVDDVDTLGFLTKTSTADADENLVETSLTYTTNNLLSSLDLSATGGKELNDITLFYGDVGENAFGRLREIADYSGDTSFWYGRGGSIEGTARKIDALNQKYTFAYDKDIFGNVTQVNYPHGLSVFYVLDNDRRVTEVRVGSKTGLKLAKLSYNAAGDVTLIEYFNGVETEYAYDIAERITKITTHKGDRYFIDEKYAYDERGNKKSVTHADGSRAVYSYDTINRLIKAEYYRNEEDTFYDVQEYGYDVDGNRITYKDSVKNIQYKVESNKLQSYSSGGDNEEIKAEFNYKLGNEISQKEYHSGKLVLERSFSYDADNRLISADVKDDQINFETSSTYTYDYVGRRESKVVDGKTTYYGYGESLDPLIEVNDKGEIDTAHIYIGGLRIAAVEGDKLKVYHTDELGNTIGITDEDGKVTQTVRYDPFGNTNFLNGPDSNEYLFAGKPFDRETGLIYFGGRYYDPQLGRYLSRDPLAQGFNHYIYTDNNPLVKKDIFGLWGGFGGGSMDGPIDGGGEVIDLTGGGDISGPMGGVGMEGGGFDPSGAIMAGMLVNAGASFLGIGGGMSSSMDMMSLVLSPGSGSEADGRYSNKKYAERVAAVSNCNDTLTLCSFIPRQNPLGDALRNWGDAIGNAIDSVFQRRDDESVVLDDSYSDVSDLVQYDPTADLLPPTGNSFDIPNPITISISVIEPPSSTLMPTLVGGAGGISTGTGVGLPPQPAGGANEWKQPVEFESKPANVGGLQEEPDKPAATVQQQQTSSTTSNDINNAGDPVLLHSGDLTQSVIDLKIPGKGMDYEFKRTYRSRIVMNDSLGYNWDHNYNKKLVVRENGNIARFDGDARFDIYVKNEDGSYLSPSGRFDLLTKFDNGTYKIRDRHGMVNLYDGDGYITSIADSNDNALLFDYDYLGSEKRLTTVTDTLGRKIKYEYFATGDLIGKLHRIVDFAGRAVTFSYNDDLDLISVENPKGGKTTYTYSSGYSEDKGELNHNLISATDAKGQTYLYNVYSVFDRVVKQQFGSEGWFEFEYHQVAAVSECNKAEQLTDVLYRTVVRDRSENLTKYDFNCQGNPLKVEEFTRSIRPDDPDSYITTHAYNLDGLITSTTYPEGNSVEFKYDDVSQPSRGNLKEVKRIADPDRGGGDPLVTSYVYEPLYNKPVAITDPKQRTIAIQYDSKGNAVSIERPMGLVRKFQYNDNGQVTKMIDEAGAVTDYLYKDDYIIGSVQDAVGLALTKSVVRDALGNITSFTDANGNVFTYELDVLGHVTKEEDALGNITKYFYDENDKVEKIDRKNIDKWLTTEFEYNILDRPILKKEEVDADHVIVTEYQYDLNENLARVIQPEGNSMFIQYDERDLPYLVTKGYGSKDASTTAIYYDYNKDPVKIIDGLGNAVSYTYDGFDHRIQEEDALGGKTLYQYDPLGLVVGVERNGKDGALFKEAFTYDDADRLIKSSEGDGTKNYLYEYNPIGRPTKKIDPLNNGDIYAYDAAGRLVAAIDAGGNQVSYIYDANGNALSEKHGEADGVNALQYGYDPLNRLISKTDDLGNKWQYHYDGIDNLIKISDPNGNITAFEYDGIRRLVKKTENSSPLDTVVTGYEWDDNSRLVSATDANGNTTNFDYDSLNRKVSTDLPDGSLYSVEYDANSMAKAYSSPAGYKVNFSYDPTGKLVKREIAQNGVYIGKDEIGYDGIGRLTGHGSYDKNGLQLQTSSYGYDLFNNLVSNSQSGHSVVSGYNLSGDRTSLFYPSDVSLNLSVDSMGRLAGVNEGTFGSISDITYAGLNRKASVDYANDSGAVFEYDDIARLNKQKWSGPNNSAIVNYVLDHDKVGNVLQDGNNIYQYDGIYRLTADKDHIYNYDKADNFTKIDNKVYAASNLNQYTEGLVYDDDGNLIQDSEFSYEYNWRGLITEAYNVSDGLLVASYEYDALGRRVSKQDAVSGDATRYIYDGWQLIEERDVNDNVKANYIYSGLDEPVAMMKDGNIYYYHYNYQGSIVAVTNTAGEVVEKYAYDPFGNVTITDAVGNELGASTIENPFYFTGQILDSETGLYNFRNRYYNPKIGRFISRDPLGYADGMNLYAYVGNNPVNKTDPYGLRA
ncbi:MAG: hypothetical protein COV46_08445, partial [Deltaproteobacteria bacterium CG11_big_fil_rev_8_21_14_0_20_49_13]